MPTIPASAIVQVTPSVLNAGGRALDIIGLLLTNATQVPIGTIQRFESALDVKNYFGLSSTEGALAQIYFAGFDDSNIKPEAIKFTQYPTAAVPAYLRGGPLGLTLAQLQALPAGTITIPINGVNIVAASVDLSTATSFSNAATIIQAAFLQTQATATLNTIAGTTLTLGGTITGTWAAGQTVAGASVPAGTFIKKFLSGTPNTAGATYELSASATVGVGEAMTGGVVPLVTYDSVFGAFVFTTVCAGGSPSADPGFAQTIGFAADSTLANSLKLLQVEGAVISQGADPAVPGTFMDQVIQIDQDWATFMTTFDPDASGNTNKKAFADWNATQVNRWAYVCWDTDATPATEAPAVTSLGYLLQQEQASGTILLGGDGTNPVTASYAAFVCGWAASLDFTETEGRATLCFRRQSGLVATCTNESKASNLLQNGYNFYGAYATANQQFIWTYNGQISGEFLWADSYINQIWLNNGFQLALMELLQNRKSIPYNDEGYSLIKAACLDQINRGVNFGAIRAGITLSAAQAAEVNDDAGIPIAPILNQAGWYLQVKDADPQTRQARGSPPCTFWYMDGQSIQKINLASIELV